MPRGDSAYRDRSKDAPQRGLQEFKPKIDLRALAYAAHTAVAEPLRPPDHASSGLGRGSLLLGSDEWGKDPEAFLNKRKPQLAPQPSMDAVVERDEPGEQDALHGIQDALNSIKQVRKEKARKPPKPPGLDEQGQLLGSRKMVIDRVPAEDNSGLLGTCYRSPVTGAIFLKEAESWRDFTLVDLWTREEILGLAEDIAKDIHLFWPSPLKKRTWIYHCLTRSCQENNDIGEMDNLIQKALHFHVSDENMNNGEWSPVMWFAPVLPLTLLTNDFLTFAMSFVLLLICHLISIFLNTTGWWMFTRVFSLPLRLGFLALLFWRLSVMESFHIISVFGFIVPMIAFIVDFLLGDVQVLSCLRYRCTYKVLRQLPNQVYVCQRSGNVGRKAHSYREFITGITGGGIALIANVSGLLCELVPMNPKKDVRELKDENNRALDRARGKDNINTLDETNGDFHSIESRFRYFRMKYYGQDVFNVMTPSAQHIAEIEEKSAQVKQWAQQNMAPPPGTWLPGMSDSHVSFFGSNKARFNFGSDDYKSPKGSIKGEPLQVQDV
mmetsp:Transcript_72525/g.137056  ORF Transcript_72525/g.137056 Transcript_72525/m.137056 type:complete len:551 (-) Transcript_72525:48-1700(-)